MRVTLQSPKTVYFVKACRNLENLVWLCRLMMVFARMAFNGLVYVRWLIIRP
jgi:hypothetical protein